MLSEVLCYPRPGLLNDEANLNVYDADFAREQTGVFEADREKSHRVTLAEWNHRPCRRGSWSMRRDSFARSCSPPSGVRERS